MLCVVVYEGEIEIYILLVDLSLVGCDTMSLNELFLMF